MSRGVKFMSLFEVAILLARMQDRKVGIDITIFLLCFSYKVYCIISKFFKCLIRFIGEGVGNGFKPFGKVGILKYPAVKCTFFKSCSNFKVVDTVAWLCVSYFIVECFPLVRDDFFSDKSGVFVPEKSSTLSAFNGSKFNFFVLILFLVSGAYKLHKSLMTYADSYGSVGICKYCA